MQEIEAESLAEQFIALGLDKGVEVLDVACGTGVVGEEIRAAGYTNVDGLDPSQGYLNGAMAKGIFRLWSNANNKPTLLYVTGKFTKHI